MREGDRVASIAPLAAAELKKASAALNAELLPPPGAQLELEIK